MGEDYLKRDGQSRSRRYPPQLDPGYAKLDERTTADLIDFASAYAKLLVFYDGATNLPAGDWSPFFPRSAKDIAEAPDGNAEPHLALYLAFLRLMETARSHLNGITKRHLDFYYERVLRLQRKPAVPDRAHVVFELKKNAKDQMLPAGTLLSAGKDPTGKELFYSLAEALVVHPARVEQLKSVHVDKGVVRAAPVADSYDGQGAPFGDKPAVWKGFGRPDLPSATIGFAVAAPVLLLGEGARTIVLTVTLNEALPWQGAAPADFFMVQLTCAKGWFPATASTTSGAGLTFTVTVTLDERYAPVTSAQPVHALEGATAPAMRVEVDAQKYGNSFPTLSIAALDLAVTVTGVRRLALENEYGKLNPAKPFMPFGPVPAKGSTLYIDVPELTGKEPIDCSLKVTWKVPVTALQTIYAGYTETKMGAYIDGEYKRFETPIVTGNGYFKATATVLGGGDRTVDLFSEKSAEDEAVIELPDPATVMTADGADAMFALTLKTSFLHEVYRRLLPQRTAEIAAGNSGVTIPGEPYTPVISSLTLNYSAHAGRIELFHIHPFGQSREYRGEAAGIAGTPILPAYRNNGELYIGVSGILPGQNLALLFQVDEGSENGDVPKATPEWSVLAEDGWLPVETVADGTNGLLKSGIVVLPLPGKGTSVGTVLPSGLYWIRGAIAANADAVCALVEVAANGAVVEFVDRENDPRHLATPLPAGSIMKLVEPLGTIKSVTQNYPSFGGRTREDDRSFYSRASERLRHKNRAVTVWDYERLVLEAFPVIYKAKCLPFTSGTSDNAPGNVTVVVVPDIKKKETADFLTPKVSKNVRDEIAAYLQARAGLFVTVNVENPRYEEVVTEFAVVFRKGFYEGTYYKEELNTALKEYLSPWAFAAGKEIPFGGKVHKSQIIHFVEDLSYVEYIEDFKMYLKEDGRDSEYLWASDPRAILVSTGTHKITPL